jgi:sulfite dehydrogenase
VRGRGENVRLLVALAVVAAVVLVAAGLAGARTSAGQRNDARAAKIPASVLAAGKKLFKANCATCHTLKEAGTHGTVGPNLDKVKRSLSYIETQVTNGGRFMPPFGVSAGGSFSAAKIKEVAEFVYSAEHK